MQPPTKCHRCINADKIYKDKNGRWMVKCNTLGLRRARCNKAFCEVFHEKYQFVLINMDKDFSEWKWIKKEIVNEQKI